MKVIKAGKLKFELRSALLAGSGFSFAGVIDNDICFDAYGIPYLPAKRVKGCLRETLESSLYAIYPGRADELLGESGSDRPCGVSIGNAYLPERDMLIAAINERKTSDKAVSFYDPQNILSVFSTVVSQTQIGKDGVAKDNSLRYSRVIGQHNPLKDGIENLVFVADVLFTDEVPEDHPEQEGEIQAILSAMAKGTRHIGLKRNRGMGNVHCSLTDVHLNKISAVKDTVQGIDSEKTCAFSYQIRNVFPLMVSGRTTDESENVILGQEILGLLADRYLHQPGKNPESAEFQDLFLNGTVHFSNLYPCKGGEAYYPAPEYINQLKKSKKIINNLAKISDRAGLGDEYRPEFGNQPKKLKKKYVSMHENVVDIHEVEKEVAFHHSHRTKNADGDEGLLYSMEVISEGQEFIGRIDCPAKYESLLKSLLLQDDLYFGKSRSAQYGKCMVLTDSIQELDSTDNVKTFPKGGHLVITFLSDSIFINKRGEYTVYSEEVADVVAEELLQKQNTSSAMLLAEEEESPYLSMLQTTLATGYRSIWNLRRAHVPAIKAGSCIVFTLSEDVSIPEGWIGERNHEGYGLYRLDLAERMTYAQQTKAQVSTPVSGLSKTADEAVNNQTSGLAILRTLAKHILLRAWLDELEFQAINKNKVHVSKSALGRLTLMLRESVDENPDNPESVKDAFKERIASIKTDSVRREGERLLENTEKQIRDSQENTTSAALEELSVLGFTHDQIQLMTNVLWADYLMSIFVELKYRGGME